MDIIELENILAAMGQLRSRIQRASVDVMNPNVAGEAARRKAVTLTKMDEAGLWFNYMIGILKQQ